MRIIAGRAGGLKLKSLKGRDVRPTLDRVKESMFNIIAFDLPGAEVLDLFAALSTISRWPFVIGSKLPGYTIFFAILPFPPYYYLS